MQASTLLSCLTPPGAGAIATIAVAGKDAWSVTCAVFHRLGSNLQLPLEPSAGKFWLGRVGTEAQGADQVVLAVKQAHPQPSLELHCHGGVEVVRFLSEVFVSHGAVPCSWAVMPHISGSSPLRRLALENLVHAPTVRTAAILLDQYHGAFENALQEILESLRKMDYQAATRVLMNLVRYLNLSSHLVTPIRVAIAGPPNVGKSSLVNALAGFTRSVVSPTPGTTRDVVTTLIALDGWPVELIDTAGLRPAGDDLEMAGMQRARAALEQADLRLWVLDGSTSSPFGQAPPAGMTGFIINKIDLPAAWNWTEAPGSRACVSALTGQGLSELCQWIAFFLNTDKAIEPGQPMPFTPELADKTWAAHEHARRKQWDHVTTIVSEMLAAKFQTSEVLETSEVFDRATSLPHPRRSSPEDSSAGPPP